MLKCHEFCNFSRWFNVPIKDGMVLMSSGNAKLTWTMLIALVKYLSLVKAFPIQMIHMF